MSAKSLALKVLEILLSVGSSFEFVYITVSLKHNYFPPRTKTEIFHPSPNFQSVILASSAGVLSNYTLAA